MEIRQEHSKAQPNIQSAVREPEMPEHVSTIAEKMWKQKEDDFKVIFDVKSSSHGQGQRNHN